MRFSRFGRRTGSVSALPAGASPSSWRKSAAYDLEIGERQERAHLRADLGNAAIAHLAIAELAFDDAEDMLDLGVHPAAEAAIAGVPPLRQSATRFSFTAHRMPASCAARFFASLA